MTPTKNETRKQHLAGALAGLLAGAAGIAAAEAVAAVLNGVTSPLLAVANRAVDAAPRPVKEWAIETFGTADKPVLIGGVIATVAGLAIAAGIVGVRRPRAAAGAFLLLTAVATAATLTDRAAAASAALRLVPVVALVVVGLTALLLLLRALRTPHAPTEHEGPAASPNETLNEKSAERAPVETVENGKSRMLLPSHVSGDDLPAAFDRRAFLRAAAAVGAIAAAGGVTSSLLGGPEAAAARADLTIPMPDSAAPPLAEAATLDVDGITPYLTSNKDFYRVDTALQVPDVPLDSFTLRIHGMVEKELELSFEDLLSRRLVERRITLTCVSNPVGGEYVGNATWIGVPIRDLLMEAGVIDGADAVKSTSADDFTAGTPLPVLLDENREALIAVAMNGQPLPLEHGFPVRMVTPGLYGYVSATKWLVDLEVTRFADFKAYWTTRGYSAKAPIKTSSRIDVPRSFARVKAGKTPVAGVAWSQDRGIDKVEVRVDGEWREADLGESIGDDAWRQWTLEWDAPTGLHQISVRATDGSGQTQSGQPAPPRPDGAEGHHTIQLAIS